MKFTNLKHILALLTYVVTCLDLSKKFPKSKQDWKASLSDFKSEHQMGELSFKSYKTISRLAIIELII